MAATTAKKRQRKFKLAELREQAIDSMSQLASIEVEDENGDVYEIPHPMLCDDETQSRVEHFQAGEGLDRDEDDRIVVPHRIDGKLAEPDAIRFARALMGDEAHAKFVAGGGRSNDVQLAWNYLVTEHKKREDADPK